MTPHEYQITIVFGSLRKDVIHRATHINYLSFNGMVGFSTNDRTELYPQSEISSLKLEVVSWLKHKDEK